VHVFRKFTLSSVLSHRKNGIAGTIFVSIQTDGSYQDYIEKAVLVFQKGDAGGQAESSRRKTTDVGIGSLQCSPRRAFATSTWTWDPT
jgi:hypothetical protein